MIPNVLPFQPEAAPAVLSSVGRGAATPASDSGSFAGLLQVKLPGQGDSPASAKGADGGSAQPTFSALFPTDNGANTTADAAALFAGADSVATNLTGAPQTLPQFAMGKGNQFGFPTGNVAGEVAMDLATSGAVVASEAAATPALQQGKDAAPSVAASKQTDQETPSAAADTAVPSPQIAALAAAAMVAATSTMTAVQPADAQGSEPVAAVSTSAAPLPAALQATATTALSSQAMADAVLPQPEGANAGANQNPIETQPNSQMNPVAGTPAGGSAAGGAVAPEMVPVNSGASAAQAGTLPNPVREQGASFREERSAHMVRVLYGSGYHAKTDPKEDAAQQQTTAELRETGVQAQRPDTKTGVTEKTAPVSAEATPSNTVQSQVVKPQASVAGPTLPGTVTVRQEADAQAAQPAQSGAAADATGGITTAKDSIRENGTAAAGTVQQGEIKEAGRGAEQPQVKVVEGGAPNATVKAETGRNGGFADPERKEQDQKAPAKEGTQQAQQPLGIGTAQQAPAEATAPETKSAATTTALHDSILSQIKDGAVVHDGNGNGQINIRLNPNDLGELKIQVRMDSSNNVHVEVQADNKMVKDLLLSNVQSLKDTLAAKNFTMEGFDVSTGSQGGFNNQLRDDQANAWQQQQRPATRSASLVSYSDDVEPARVNYLTGDVNNLLSVRL